MATTLSITSGALSSSRTYQNDTKARATLLAFYTEMNLGPAGATNQQKLDAVLDWIIFNIRDVARQQYMQAAKEASRTQAETDYAFE